MTHVGFIGYVMLDQDETYMDGDTASLQCSHLRRSDLAVMSVTCNPDHLLLLTFRQLLHEMIRDFL